MNPEAGDLARQFALFARTSSNEHAPLYERLCAGVAEDPEVLALAATSPPEQRRPNLLLASVHFLLLGHQPGGEALSAHYPTLAAPGTPTAEGDPYPAFRAFCLEHVEALEPLLATRATQTNEVGRCAAVLPALLRVAEQAQAPLSVIDLGAAAGLNLLFDRYAYRYELDHDEVMVGAAGSPVELPCRVSGHPDLGMPEVAWRRGVDREPLDPTDLVASRWLLACVFADHVERFTRLAAALALARDDPERPVVEAGDMVDDVEHLVDQAPADSAVCLLQTWSAAYLLPEAQQALVEAVTRAGRRRPLDWVFAESAYEIPGLPVPEAPPGRGDKRATALVRVRAQADGLAAERLGDIQSHGRWLRWFV